MILTKKIFIFGFCLYSIFLEKNIDKSSKSVINTNIICAICTIRIDSCIKCQISTRQQLNGAKTWKTPWKVCKTSSKLYHFSTFPHPDTVEKWKSPRSIYSNVKNRLVEFLKKSKFTLTKKYSSKRKINSFLMNIE